MSTSNTRRRLGRLALGSAAGLVLAASIAPGCDDGPRGEPATMAVSVSALSGGACGNPENPTPGVDPTSDIEDVTVFISGTNADGEAFDICEAHGLGGSSLTVASVPEGDGHTLELFGTGGQLTWYAAEPELDVQRNAETTIELLLVPYGGFACVPTDTTYPNVLFPASVELPDGKILITGGFTAVQSDGGKQYLAQPTNQAVLFDPRTGSLEHLGSMGTSGTAGGRGGHAMAFIASQTGEHGGKVLIVGGLTRLELDLDGGFPVVADDTKAEVLNDYILYDVATRTFTAGSNKMDQKRAFPRVYAMPDETVLISGGGSWPEEDSTAYLDVELYQFDSDAPGGTGKFLSTKSFTSYYARSGHSLTFVKSTEDGLAQLLMWGGTTADDGDDGDGADFAVAELVKQSALQTDPVSPIDGSFQNVEVKATDGSSIPRTFFHEMTALTSEAFLLTGGAKANDAKDGLKSPSNDAAWVIVYRDDDGPEATVTKVPGMGAGRVFHSAFSPDGENVAVLGGLSGGSAVDTDTIRFFDFLTGNWATGPEAGSSFVSRGGHTTAPMRSGSVLLLGGESDLDGFGVSPHRAFVEVYTPSIIPGIQEGSPCSGRVE